LTLLSPVGTYLLAKRQLRDKLKTEYEYEQRKKLRDLIGRYHGRILQTVEEFNYRMLSLYRSEGAGWLDVGEDYDKVGSTPERYYYFRTTVYRFLALFAVVREFEAEALFIDSRIADRTDFEFVKYLRAMVWVATDTHLFEGLAYDTSTSKDHFFRDQLRRACECCWVQNENEENRFVSLDEFRAMIGKEQALESVLDYFNGLRSDEDRYRWDRLVSLHLILLAFLDDFGYEFQRSPREIVNRVAGMVRNPEVARNLSFWLTKLGLVRQTRDEPQYMLTWILHRVPQVRTVRERHIRRVNKPLKKRSPKG